MQRRLAPGVAIQVVLTSVLTLVGTLVVFVSQIFGWVFVPMTDVRALTDWGGAVERDAGRVVSIEPTHTRVNNRPVVEVRFEHDAAPGRTLSSYTTSPGTLRPGETVAVEYPAGHPERARVEHMSAKPMPAWVLVAVAVPLVVGLVLFGIGLALGLRKKRLLERGEIVRGTLVDKRPTRTRVNRRTVYRFTFEATTSDGSKRRVVGRTHRVEDVEQRSDLAIDPGSGAGVALATLPGAPRVAADDSIELSRTGAAGKLALVAILVAFGGWIAQIVFHASRV